MLSTQIDPWHDLFTMAGSASAALVGLLFVAVSLNHEQILTMPTLPELAGVSITLLIGVTVLSVAGLTPGQNRVALGVEVLVVGVAVTVITFALVLTRLSHLTHRGWRVTRLALTAASTLPALVCGATLVAGVGGGLYWAALEIVAALVTATYNAWVLLIEIRR